MAIKAYTQWIEHGWWITATSTEDTMLSITERAIQNNHRWSPLGSKFGKLDNITTGPSDVLFMHVITEEGERAKYKMQRNWLMAPIPSVLVDIPTPKRVLPSLKRHWSSMPIEIQRARSAIVEQFMSFTPEDILRARRFINAAMAYKEMQRANPESVRDKTPPREPEETDPTYRILAALLNVQWIPVHERGRVPSTEGEDTVELGRGGISHRGTNSRGRERSGRSTGSSSCTGETLRRERVERTSPRSGPGPLIFTNVSVRNMPKASVTQARAVEVEENQAPAPRNIERGRRMDQSGEEKTELRVRPRVAAETRTSGVQEHQSVVKDISEEGEDYIGDDGVSDDEDRSLATRSGRSSGPLVRFPTHEEYMKGYI